MRWILASAVVAVALYASLLLAVVVWQRRLLYFPGGPEGPAPAFGLPAAQTLRLTTADGATIVAWYQLAEAGKPLFVYFHGNGGTLAIRAALLRDLSADGSGFLAIDYRGYGGSTGTPTEQGLLEDGRAAYAEARQLGYGPERIVLVGESLGTAVAIAVAAEQPVHALVLDSAFTSTVDVGAAHYWMFPVRLLMKDTFDSASRIGRVAAPKLFLHGTDDVIVPVRFGRRLFDAAPDPKTFIDVPGHDHIVLWVPNVMEQMKAWVDSRPL